jgi:hypothetical protein
LRRVEEGEGGAAEVNQPPRLPLALRRLPRHRRPADRSHLAVTTVRREEETGEAGAAEASGLPGHPTALHHSTPPSTRSRRARHNKTTTAGARRGKEEQLRSLGLPGCPRGATTATPPSCCTVADRPPGTGAGPLRRAHTTSTTGSGHLAPCAAAEGYWAH